MGNLEATVNPIRLILGRAIPLRDWWPTERRKMGPLCVREMNASPWTQRTWRRATLGFAPGLHRMAWRKTLQGAQSDRGEDISQTQNQRTGGLSGRIRKRQLGDSLPNNPTHDRQSPDLVTVFTVEPTPTSPERLHVADWLWLPLVLHIVLD